MSEWTFVPVIKKSQEELDKIVVEAEDLLSAYEQADNELISRGYESEVRSKKIGLLTIGYKN